MQIEIRKPLITFSSSTNPLLPSLPLHTPYYLLFLYKPLITFSSFTNPLLPSLPLQTPYYLLFLYKPLITFSSFTRRPDHRTTFYHFDFLYVISQITTVTKRHIHNSEKEKATKFLSRSASGATHSTENCDQFSGSGGRGILPR